MISNIDFEKVNVRLERMNPAEILTWTLYEAFPDKRVALTSSFQSQSLPLLYLVSKICSHLPVYFLDTGFHFSETLDYIERLRQLLTLNMCTIRPLSESSDNEMYKTDPDMCCYLRKVETLQRVFSDVDIWISGIRRDQTSARSVVKIIDFHEPLGVIKVSPMANFTSSIQKEFNARISLPEHPLLSKGYRSIGCAPCTKPTKTGEDPRAGRWGGTGKSECGLHFDPKTGKVGRTKIDNPRRKIL